MARSGRLGSRQRDHSDVWIARSRDLQQEVAFRSNPVAAALLPKTLTIAVPCDASTFRGIPAMLSAARRPCRFAMFASGVSVAFPSSMSNFSTASPTAQIAGSSVRCSSSTAIPRVAQASVPHQQQGVRLGELNGEDNKIGINHSTVVQASRYRLQSPPPSAPVRLPPRGGAIRVPTAWPSLDLAVRGVGPRAPQGSRPVPPPLRFSAASRPMNPHQQPRHFALAHFADHSVKIFNVPKDQASFGTGDRRNDRCGTGERTRRVVVGS